MNVTKKKTIAVLIILTVCATIALFRASSLLFGLFVDGCDESPRNGRFEALNADINPHAIAERTRGAWKEPEPEPEYGEWIAVTATAYCACEKCCGIYASGYTASGTWATEGRTIAADTRIFPFGTVLELEGIGERIVEDVGGAIKGNRIDVFFEDHETANKFGVRTIRVRERISEK